MTLIAATGENTKIQADIHSVGVHELGENADRFLRQLAARNGGTYRRISR